MSQTVADVMWEMLVSAGVTRCYGIVGDALNPVIDALRRNGENRFRACPQRGVRGVRRCRGILPH
ncbi:MAG: thiamine pyrophosphate-binding protein [Acidobacteriota bacterium]